MAWSVSNCTANNTEHPEHKKVCNGRLVTMHVQINIHACGYLATLVGAFKFDEKIDAFVKFCP